MTYFTGGVIALAAAVIILALRLVLVKEKRALYAFDLLAVGYLLGVYTAVISGAATWPPLKNGSLTVWGIGLVALAIINHALDGWKQ